MLKRIFCVLCSAALLASCFTLTIFAATEEVVLPVHDGHMWTKNFIPTAGLTGIDNFTIQYYSNGGGTSGNRPYVEMTRKARETSVLDEYLSFGFRSRALNGSDARNAFEAAGNTGTYKLSFDYCLFGAQSGDALVYLHKDTSAAANLFDNSGIGTWQRYEGSFQRGGETLGNSGTIDNILDLRLCRGNNGTDEGYVGISVANIILSANDGTVIALKPEYIALSTLYRQNDTEVVSKPPINFTAAYQSNGNMKLSWENPQFTQMDNTGAQGYQNTGLHYLICDTETEEPIVTVNSLNGTDALRGSKYGYYTLEDELGYLDGKPYDFTVKTLDARGNLSNGERINFEAITTAEITPKAVGYASEIAVAGALPPLLYASEVIDVSLYNTNGALEHQETVTTDADGEYSCTFEENLYSGDYDVVVTWDSVNEWAETKRISYVNPNEQTILLEIANDPTTTVAEMEDIINNRAAVIGLDKSIYDAYLTSEQQTSVTATLVAAPAFGSIPAFVAAFWDAALLKAVNVTDTADNIGALIAEPGVYLQQNRVYGLYSALSTEGAALVNDAIAKKTDFSDFANASNGLTAFFESNTILASIEKIAGYDEVYDILHAYTGKGVLSIDFSVYNTLNYKSVVLQSISGKRFGSLTELDGAFSAAVTTQKKVEDDTPNQQSGQRKSGGGGGSSSIIKIADPSAITPSVVTDVKPPSNNESAGTARFVDMESAAWAAMAVESLADRGIVHGYDDSAFRPQANITRAEFVKLLVTAFAPNSADASSSFDDVKEGDWYYQYVSQSVALGFVMGYENNVFAPDSNISREDMAVMIARVAKNHGFAAKDAAGFADSAFIADYAADSVALLQSLGLVKGADNMFYPEKSATRAESAYMIYNLLNMMEGLAI